MRIHHLALRTQSPRELAKFYRGVLGLPELRSSRDGRQVRSIWLDAGGTILMIERAEPGEPAIPERTMELVAFAVSQTQHRRLRARLRRRRVPLDGETAFTSYFRDPDGRRVGISHFSADAEQQKRRARRKAM